MVHVLTGWTGVTLRSRAWYHFRTRVPNLDWSFDAPTTANRGAERNVDSSWWRVGGMVFVVESSWFRAESKVIG